MEVARWTSSGNAFEMFIHRECLVARPIEPRIRYVDSRCAALARVGLNGASTIIFAAQTKNNRLVEHYFTEHARQSDTSLWQRSTWHCPLLTSINVTGTTRPRSRRRRSS